MMSQFNHIKISSLKFLIVASLLLEYKEVLESPSWHTYEIFNHSKQTTNEEDMGLKLEKV
jgi:hypothetical protein